MLLILSKQNDKRTKNKHSNSKVQFHMACKEGQFDVVELMKPISRLLVSILPTINLRKSENFKMAKNDNKM